MSIVTKMIVIKHKYRQLTRAFFLDRLSKQESPRKQPTQGSSSIKLETLTKENPNHRHSPERSRTQLEYLSIDKYTPWQLLLISIYKIYTINKNSTDIAEAVTAMSHFYFGFE